MNLLQWECGIPGKEGGLWAEGTYKLMLTFNDSYPANSPNGSVCLSILSHGWKPTISIKQALLDEPNPKSPANQDAYYLYSKNRKKYEEAVRAFAAKFKPDTGSADTTIL